MMNQRPTRKISLKLAIVGGGRACKFFLKLIRLGNLPTLDIDIIGVCDINPQAVGFQQAREQGIFTTTDFKDLFALKDLDGIIELTNNQDLLVEMIQLRPPRIGIIEHNIGRLLRNFFTVNEKFRSVERQIVFEKAIRSFLIQQTQQCIVVINKDFTIDAVNDAFCRATGKIREEVIGERCYRAIRELDAPCDTFRNGIVCPMVETLRTGKSTKGVLSVVLGEQRAALHDIVTYPVRNAKGEIIRIIEIWLDIGQEIASRWKKREQELKSDFNKLVQEDRLISLGKLVASCVHEINNPVQGLLTFSHLMMEILATDDFETDDIVRMREFAKMMAEELARCGKIISGLLSFSRQTPKAFKTIDLNDVVATVADLIRHRLELQDITFSIDLAPMPVFVHGDTNQLQQCFLNLVFNAIEAMGHGGRLKVVSKIDEASQKVDVTVGDTGPGISQNHLDHIFDPFFTTKTVGEGTGMGLSIVYGVIKQHRGNIVVHSTSGKGTTFIVQLPLAAPSYERAH